MAPAAPAPPGRERRWPNRRSAPPPRTSAGAATTGPTARPRRQRQASGAGRRGGSCAPTLPSMRVLAKRPRAARERYESPCRAPAARPIIRLIDVGDQPMDTPIADMESLTRQLRAAMPIKLEALTLGPPRTGL